MGAKFCNFRIGKYVHISDILANMYTSQIVLLLLTCKVSGKEAVTEFLPNLNSVSYLSQYQIIEIFKQLADLKATNSRLETLITEKENRLSKLENMLKTGERCGSGLGVGRSSLGAP